MTPPGSRPTLRLAAFSGGFLKTRPGILAGLALLAVSAAYIPLRPPAEFPSDLKDALNEEPRRPFGGYKKEEVTFEKGKDVRSGIGGTAVEQEALSQGIRDADGRVVGFTFKPDLVQGADGGPNLGLRHARWGNPERTGLVFIAAQHNNPATGDLVRTFLSGRMPLPKVVIVEIEPTRPPDHCTSGGGKDSEGCVAKRMVDDKNREANREIIKLVYGEYAPPLLLKAFAEHGKYTAKDYMGFWLVRTLSNMKKDQLKELKSWSQAYDKLSKDFQDEFKPDPRKVFKDAAEFTAWYEGGNSKPSGWLANNWRGIDPGETGRQGGLLTQQVLKETLIVRDLHLGRLIEGGLNDPQYGSLLVVYGGAHYADLKPAIIHMLGVPLYEK